MENFQINYGIKNMIKRIVETVTSRIFYEKRNNWTNQMTFSEFVASDILGLIKKLETVEDMNSVTFYF